MKFIYPPKNADCSTLLKHIFDLNKLDVKVYKDLTKSGEIRVDILAKKLNRDRATVYRSLQKLISYGLCTREKHVIKTGGYYHVYSALDLDSIREKMKSCIEEWYRSMKEMVEMFDN